MVAIVIIIAANIWGKGMIKIIPILLGVIGSYVIAVIADPSVRETLVNNVADRQVVRASDLQGRDRLRSVHRTAMSIPTCF